MTEERWQLGKSRGTASRLRWPCILCWRGASFLEQYLFFSFIFSQPHLTHKKIATPVDFAEPHFVEHLRDVIVSFPVGLHGAAQKFRDVIGTAINKVAY
jgi:hypothetical protein